MSHNYRPGPRHGLSGTTVTQRTASAFKLHLQVAGCICGSSFGYSCHKYHISRMWHSMQIITVRHGWPTSHGLPRRRGVGAAVMSSSTVIEGPPGPTRSLRLKSNQIAVRGLLNSACQPWCCSDMGSSFKFGLGIDPIRIPCQWRVMIA